MANKAYEPDRTRTLAIVGHRSSGKTSLGDALLAATGVTRERLSVDAGTSLLDHEVAARQRQMSTQTSFAWMPWNEHLLNLVDTPGSAGFLHEAAVVLSGVDGAFVVVSGPDGLEVGSEQTLLLARQQGVPCAVVVNKMDRGVDLPALLAGLEAATGARAVPMQVPFNDHEGRFCGVASLLMRRALRYDAVGSGAYSAEPLPLDLASSVSAAWDNLMEAVALSDDALLERYLEFLELPLEDVRAGLAAGMAAGTLLPVLFTAGHRSIGVHALLDFAVWAFPSPLARTRSDEPSSAEDGPFRARLLASQLDESGQLFHVLRVLSGTPSRGDELSSDGSGKTARLRKLYQLRGPRRKLASDIGPGSIVATWEPVPGRPGSVWSSKPVEEPSLLVLPEPMVSWMVEPVGKTAAAELQSCLLRLIDMDAGLHLSIDSFTGNPVLSGTDGVHLDVSLSRLRKQMGLDIASSLPPVHYVEAPASSVDRVQGVHKRGGDIDMMEFGECWVSITQGSPNGGNHFEAKTDEERLPRRFIPAVEDGVQCGLMHGPTAGYPVVGADVLCFDGEYDMFSSTDEHLKLAGEAAVRNALEQTGSRILEPWADLSVQVPADGVGDILQHLAANRGQITGMDVVGRVATIEVAFPERELQHFAPRLQSLTHGRGRFERKSKHYRFLPKDFEKEVIASSPFLNRAARPDPGTPKPTVREKAPMPEGDAPSVPGVKL